MKKLLLLPLFAVVIIVAALAVGVTKKNKNTIAKIAPSIKITLPKKTITEGDELRDFINENDFNADYCFLMDMSLPSNKKRFFIYDLVGDSVLERGMAAHGSCNKEFLKDAVFSNKPKGGCSSVGKYKVGPKYKGKYGESYLLYGLEESNSNAFSRNIVIHGFKHVPDNETKYPIGNSLGCPMVSINFLKKIAESVEKSNKPILLWIYE